MMGCSSIPLVGSVAVSFQKFSSPFVLRAISPYPAAAHGTHDTRALLRLGGACSGFRRILFAMQTGCTRVYAMWASKEGRMDGALVLVPWDHLGEVRALLERLESKDGAGGVEDESAERSRPELLRRVYDDCAETTKRVLLHLARYPDEWVYGHVLAREANPESESINSSPYMKSMNLAVDRHFREGDEPLVVAERGRDRLFRFKVPSHEDAEILRGFASQTPGQGTG